MSEVDNSWHLDRKVPIALIVALLGQAAMGLWFASKLDARIGALESAQTAQHERDERQDKASSEGFAAVTRQLERIDAKLDRLIEGRKQ